MEQAHGLHFMSNISINNLKTVFFFVLGQPSNFAYEKLWQNNNVHCKMIMVKEQKEGKKRTSRTWS